MSIRKRPDIRRRVAPVRSIPHGRGRADLRRFAGPRAPSGRKSSALVHRAGGVGVAPSSLSIGLAAYAKATGAENLIATRVLRPART